MPDKIDIAELEDALRTEFDSRTDMEHDTIINAARAYLDMVTWRPIETAPKEIDRQGDCPSILTFPSYRITSYCHELEGFWHWCDRHDEARLLPRQPTHWLPLPTPPTGEKK